MLFVRLVWCALLTALVVGSIQFGVQRWHAVPILHAAEVFESRKVDHSEQGHAHDESGAAAEDGMGYRAAWTWVANVLHGLSMALLMFAVMGWWIWRRGGGVPTWRLTLAVASAGFLSLYLWPALGLPAELPGIDAAALKARQAWWLFAALSAALACASMAGIATHHLPRHWRWLVAVLFLALPFVVGPPQPAGDPLAGFSVRARAELQDLEREFIWTAHWIALSFWISLGGVGGWVFGRWVKSAIPPASEIRVDYPR